MVSACKYCPPMQVLYENQIASYYINSVYYSRSPGNEYLPFLSPGQQVAGPTSIPPRYAFGVYYSRYHAYNDVEEMVHWYKYY